MRLIKPSFKIEAINGDDLLLMESAGRTCYKSEPKGDPGKFLASKIKAGHTTIIEHVSHGFRIKIEGSNSYLLSQVQEIQEETFGMQTSFTNDFLYISINPRTLREAKLEVNNNLTNYLLAKLLDAKKFNCLYSDLNPNKDYQLNFIKLLTNEEKLNLPIDIRDKHNYMTVRLIADRGFTHELVRHRMAVYSQESTRYCNYSGEVTFIIPPWVDIEEKESLEIGELISPEELLIVFKPKNDIDTLWLLEMSFAERAYTQLIKEGWVPQQARSVLPNSLKTEIAMTANFREWRLVFEQRALGTTGKPHPQMSEVMILLLEETKTKVPMVFDDLIIK